MSGTTGEFGAGFWQPLAAPAAIALVLLPSCPLHAIAVLDRIEQPDKFTTGAPFRSRETCEVGCAASSVRMHESSPGMALAAAFTFTGIVLTLKTPSTDVGTVVAALAEYVDVV